MRLSKKLTNVTSFSKIVAAILFILLPLITFFGGIQYQNNVSNRVNRNAILYDSSSLTPTKSIVVDQADLCNFILDLPSGYYYQNPINSFYGNRSTTTGKGNICKVILGPKYKAQYEGFSGEQIQINAYSTNSTQIGELIQGAATTDEYLPLHGYRFTRPSYGGEDEVLVFENNYVLYEIVWRNNPENIENVIKQIASQL